MNKYPICIISKDRHDICTTHLLFDDYNIKYYYMVEPQDYDLYKSKFKNVINIQENNLGIYYARNFCIDWSKKNGYDKHWQADDDIKSFYYRPKTEKYRDRIKINNPTKMLLEMENTSNVCVNFGASCISHDGFVFSKKNDIDINKMIYCFQLINNNTFARYQPDISEDIDFSLQLLFQNYVTLIYNTYSFTTPQSGSMQGGCNASVDYNNNGRKKRNIELVNKYPQWFNEYTKKGLSEIKPSKIWRTFKQVPMQKK